MSERKVTEAEVQEYSPYRVEIKENSKGEPSVSVRATHEVGMAAVEEAVAMYEATRKELGLS